MATEKLVKKILKKLESKALNNIYYMNISKTIQDTFRYVWSDFDTEDEEDTNAGYEDYNDNPHTVFESLISEKLIRKKVIRKGKKLVKWKTDKEGYRVAMVNGRPKEVKMSSQEKLKRKKASKKSVIKRKAKSAQSNKNRRKSLKRRSSMGIK